LKATVRASAADTPLLAPSNAIRNDLQHPNEYIRGSTLRFLQKIREPELLEPLVPTILSCLEHRHSFVRKNAVFCIYMIYQRHPNMFSDAPELMETFLAAEQDATCKRNAFVLLCHAAPDKAVEYLKQQWEGITSMDELMQLAVIELIRKECKGENANRVSARLVRMHGAAHAASDAAAGKVHPRHLRAPLCAQPRRQVRGGHHPHVADAERGGDQGDGVGAD
jgi:hypothetical protein